MDLSDAIQTIQTTDQIEEETHWIPTSDESYPYEEINITIGQSYEVYKFDDGYWITNDEGIPSMIWLIHKGLFVINKEEK